MALKSKLKATVLLLPGLFGASSVLANTGDDISRFNMREGVTDVSAVVYDMHMMVLWIMLAISVIVFGAMIWSIIFHTKKRNPKPATFSHSTTVEVIWTAIPFAILVGMAVPATTALVDMYDTSEADMTIKVTGYRWYWQYEYMDNDISFFSNLSTPKEVYEGTSEEKPEDRENYLLEVDNEMVIPVNKKIRLLLTADDVIHSWWVPEFAVKKDTIPGFINEAWTRVNKPGVYRGQCTELCGKYHGFMPVVVRAVEQDEYDAWVKKKLDEQAAKAEAARLAALQDWSKEKLMKLGQEVYVAQCQLCHGAKGEGGVGKAITNSPIATGPTAQHISIVYNGNSAGMPAFNEKLSSAEMAAVLTFQRNALGNNVGDLIQPAEIEKLKQ